MPFECDCAIEQVYLLNWNVFYVVLYVDQNAQKVKNERLLRAHDKTVCKFSAKMPFLKQRTNSFFNMKRRKKRISLMYLSKICDAVHSFSIIQSFVNGLASWYLFICLFNTSKVHWFFFSIAVSAFIFHFLMSSDCVIFTVLEIARRCVRWMDWYIWM